MGTARAVAARLPAAMTFIAPATPGTYDITCIAHADMGGQLIVVG